MALFAALIFSIGTSAVKSVGAYTVKEMYPPVAQRLFWVTVLTGKKEGGKWTVESHHTFT